MKTFAPHHPVDPTANAKKCLDRLSVHVSRRTLEPHLHVDLNVSLAQSVPRN